MQFVASRLCSVPRHFLLHPAQAGMQIAEICGCGDDACIEGFAATQCNPEGQAK
jgi:hypothetical protein